MARTWFWTLTGIRWQWAQEAIVPSVSGGPLRKHSPPGTALECPLHSLTPFKEQMPICTFYSQPQFWCRSIFSRTFQKVFWRDIILRASFIYIWSVQPHSPYSEQNHHFWITCLSSGTWTPSTHHKEEKDCHLGDYSTSTHVPRWRAWAKPCPLINLMVSDKHLPTQQAHFTADHLLWLERWRSA